MKRRFADLPLRFKGLVTVVLPVGALLIAVLALAYVQREQQQAEELVRHTMEVRSALASTRVRLVEAESGMRGYLLTGREEWLEPYQTTLREFPKTIAQLEHLVRDNASQLARVGRIRMHAAQRLESLLLLQQAASLSKVDFEAALVRSKESMDVVRDEIEAMQLEEDRLLRRRTSNAEEARKWMYRLLSLTAVMGLMGGVLGALLFGASVVRRVEAIQRNAQLMAERLPLAQMAPARDEIGRLSDALRQADALLSERERRLRDAESFLRHLIATSPTVIFEHDPRSMEVKYVSPNVEQILGYTPAEVLATPDFWAQHLHPDDYPRILGEDQEALAKRAPRLETEYRLRDKNGAYRWFHNYLRLEYDDSGRPLALIGHRLDVTAGKEAEQALVERQRALDATNRELEAFSYSVSHDLRAPLRSIDGFSQALLEEYSGKLDHEGRQHLARLRAATGRMGRLIDDLLDLSRLTRIEMRRADVDLSGMAAEIARDLEQEHPNRRVEFAIAPGVHGNGDPGLLRAVLENLIGNAFKFTSRKAEARIEFGATRDGGSTAYYVRDNGAGFDQEYASKLFGAFQRLHAASEFGGTGIGLATVQRVVHRHGGEVWALGAVDQGATFYFTLEPRNNGSA